MAPAGRGVQEWREELRGAGLVLALAETMRVTDCVVPSALLGESVRAARRGEVSYDDVTRLFRHAMVHAGGTRRVGGERFRVCPECEAVLGGP